MSGVLFSSIPHACYGVPKGNVKREGVELPVFICQRCRLLFRWELWSAVNGQVGKSNLHVLIVDIKKTFLFSLGMKELVGNLSLLFAKSMWNCMLRDMVHALGPFLKTFCDTMMTVMFLSWQYLVNNSWMSALLTIFSMRSSKTMM